MNIDFIETLKIYLNSFNVNLLHITPPFDELSNIDGGLRHYLNPAFDWAAIGDDIIAQASSDVLYIIEDMLGAKYALFEIPNEDDSVYVIGPWRGECKTHEQLSWANSNLEGKIKSMVDDYYNTIPKVNDHMIYSITSAFILQIYKSDKFELVHLYEAQPLNVEIDLRYFTEPDFIQERAASILEQKYEAENSIFEAVVCGDCRSALEGYQQYSSFNETNPIGRTLRQCQNDLIAFNTLLRKAIERANVHPYYIDTINNKYLKKIDEAQDQSKCAQISHDMIMDYCAYVHRYSLKQYSPLVQKVINYVNMHLDLPLSLKILSEMYFISPSYLSWLFKQETGTTLTDYINVQRMQRAAVSLVATNNSISTIAAEVGMMDVNYFSKIFKKNHGVTPTQYRRENQKAN